MKLSGLVNNLEEAIETRIISVKALEDYFKSKGLNVSVKIIDNPGGFDILVRFNYGTIVRFPREIGVEKLYLEHILQEMQDSLRRELISQQLKFCKLLNPVNMRGIKIFYDRNDPTLRRIIFHKILPELTAYLI